MKALLAVFGVIALFVVLVTIGVKFHTESETRATAAVATEQRENEEAIKQRHVLAGMSAAQVRQAWGEPTKINRTVNSNHVHEQWIYGATSKPTYLYIDDDVLRSLQDSR